MTVVDVTQDWFWEGNVVDSIARFLEHTGWVIVSKANTGSKERGVDIHAQKGGRELLVEVKGFPSKTYRDPRRATEQKPTNPTNQAQQWYSKALLKVMRLQTQYPHAIVALGFPDFPRYRALFEETKGGLEKLGVAFLTVTQNGEVQTWGM
jgi:Holliday junction resolvase-like predicted endonuclease